MSSLTKLFVFGVTLLFFVQSWLTWNCGFGLIFRKIGVHKPFRRIKTALSSENRSAWTSHHQHFGFNWTHHAKQWPEIAEGRVDFAEDETCGGYPPGTWTGKNWGDLPDLDNPPGIFPGVEVYGSRLAQWELYKHQHPQTCKGKRFMIVKALGPSEHHGIGSVIHLTTPYFLYAFWSNRIILSRPQEDNVWMQGKFCKGHKTWDSCYFLPLSNCTLDDLEMEESEIPKIHVGNMFDEKINSTLRVVHGFTSRDKRSTLMFIPDFAKAFMNHSKIRPETYYYWWRAQGAAYVIRPNNRTRKALWDLRKRVFPELTIPPGTVNVHVRRGDKWKEARLPDDDIYFAALQRMVAAYPNHLKKQVFVSTESGNTLEYFKNQTGWELFYVDAHRYDHGTRGTFSPMSHARQIGADNEMLNSLLNLELALECDAWVCLFESNWCRMIDELRSAIRCKAHMPLYAVSLKNRTSIIDYAW